MNLLQLKAHRQVLTDWASLNPSVDNRAFVSFQASVKAALAKGGSELVPCVTIPFGTSSITIYTNGEIMSVEDQKKFPFKSGVHIPTDVPAGSAATNFMIDEMRVSTGLYGLVAGGNMSKSPVATAMAGHGGREFGFVRYGEPLSGYHTDERSAGIDLITSMMKYPVVVFDSVKDLLSEAGGGAMKSGLTRGSLPMLSRWGSIAASMGVTLIVPINPSSPDDEVIELLVEAAKSNSTSAMFPISPKKWSYVTRTGEGMRRTSGSFSSSFTTDGDIVFSDFVTAGQAASAEIGRRRRTIGLDGEPVTTSMDTGISISDKDFAAAVRRSLTIVPDSE